MENKDLVTIICIAYNHEQWILETLESVRSQDYYDKELIVIDNGSSDNTAGKIKNWIKESTGQLAVKAIYNTEVQPYCKLFNQILATIKGQYLVDLSGDDILYPDHLSASIMELKNVPFAGFVFSDAFILDDMGEVRPYYKRKISGELIEPIELSNIYETLIHRNIICSPTVVFNTAILRKEGGYDESLYYEDFDVQLRIARNHPVLFSDHMGVLKRKHSNSMSATQYQSYQSKMLPSTVVVCSKIQQMNIYPEENLALKRRIINELKHALWSANFEPARDLVGIGKKLGMKSLKFKFYALWASKEWDISWLYARIT